MEHFLLLGPVYLPDVDQFPLGVHEIIISAGFGETDEEGKRLQQDITTLCEQAQVTMIGPNCLGVISPHHGLNATFSKNSASPGNLALVSQSGAICTAILDWADEIRKLGVRANADYPRDAERARRRALERRSVCGRDS